MEAETLVQLRPALAADAARLAQILIDSRRAFMPYAQSPRPDTEVRRWVCDTLIPGGGVTVAQVGGELQGLVAVTVEPTAGVDCGWIEQLYVAPAAVGRGLGGRLLRHALSTLPAPQRLHTFQANAGARHLYERAGFAPVAFGDGRANEEHCPDLLYERWAPPGARVRLRRLHLHDLDDFCAYRGDGDVGLYQGWSPMAPAQALQFLGLMHAAPPLRTGEWLQLGIARHDAAEPGPGGDRLVGDIGLLRHDAQRVEIGFTLGAESQGCGLAAEAVQLALGWLWTLPGVRETRTYVVMEEVKNSAALRL